MEKEKGSVLVLTLVGVLILSLMATGLMTVGTTEINTTRNFYLNKFAYYMAVQGIEEVRNEIANNPDPGNVGSISRSCNNPLDDPNGTLLETEGVHRSYITGSLYHMQENSPQPLEQFEGFDAPKITGTSLQQMTPIIWRVLVTAEAKMGKRAGYAEIEAGIWSFIGGYE
jgi:hypothetical protein